MTLRKDKVAAALREMRGICSDPNNPASLPEVVGQLANILGNVFDDLALPELPQIDSGEFSLPEDAPFDFPLGGGTQRSLDVNDGALGRFPGGGQPFGGFDDGGDPGGDSAGPVNNECVDEGPVHVTFLAKTAEEIPAGENGNPGQGLVKELAPRQNTEDKEQYDKCVEDVKKQYDDDIDWANANAYWATDEGGGEITIPFKNQSASYQHWKQRLIELEAEKQQAIFACNFEFSDEGPDETGGRYIARNISCEKIEKDATVVVSGTINICVARNSAGVAAWERFIPDTAVLYVIVEACGCD